MKINKKILPIKIKSSAFKKTNPNKKQFMEINQKLIPVKYIPSSLIYNQ